MFVENAVYVAAGDPTRSFRARLAAVGDPGDLASTGSARADRGSPSPLGPASGSSTAAAVPAAAAWPCFRARRRDGVTSAPPTSTTTSTATSHVIVSSTRVSWIPQAGRRRLVLGRTLARQRHERRGKPLLAPYPSTQSPRLDRDGIAPPALRTPSFSHRCAVAREPRTLELQEARTAQPTAHKRKRRIRRLVLHPCTPHIHALQAATRRHSTNRRQPPRRATSRRTAPVAPPSRASSSHLRERRRRPHAWIPPGSGRGRRATSSGASTSTIIAVNTMSGGGHSTSGARRFQALT